MAEPLRWGDTFLLRIFQCLVDAVGDLRIALLDLGAHGVGQLLHSGDVGAKCVGKVAELEGNHIGIRHPHHHRSGRLCQRASVGEVSVLEVGVPVKIVVDGVILPSALIFAAVTEVDARDSEMMDERGVVRA